MIEVADVVVRVQNILAELEEIIPELPTLTEISDGDMALMYLRHLRKELE